MTSGIALLILTGGFAAFSTLLTAACLTINPPDPIEPTLPTE